MATTQNTNTKAQELVAGKKAARLLQASIVKFIGFETVSHTGKLMASTAKARPGIDGLKDIAITQPRYGFMLNYGFEGVKSNGISMKLKATNHLADAIEKSRVLEILADELTEIKAEKVFATIDFKTRG